MDGSVMENEKKSRAYFLTKNAFKPDSYEFDESIEPFGGDPMAAKTVNDIVKCLENGSADIEARVITSNGKGSFVSKKMGKTEFLESFHKNEKGDVRLKEGIDAFSMDLDSGGGTGLVGEDYIPLLGGPFNKQLYMRDYLKMHATAFQAYHHDPVAKQVITIIKDFTLGRGFKVTCDNEAGQILWDAFSELNNIPTLMEFISEELSIYGEIMTWWLPNNEEYVSYQVAPGQKPKEKFIPRVRLIDPSVIWEIVTYPEDITRVLYYQWVAPTQYQIYTGRDEDQTVPGSKFIFQQIPAEQVDHFKVNCVSNEKRGRSDLFPVLGYLKRLRDSVSYAVIAMQKNAAWAIDTSIEGSQGDIDAYASAQEQMGTIPPAGSEFVHSNKIKREYLANQGSGKGGSSAAFDWCVSMIAIGTGIPVQYFGSHLSGQGTRGNAIVATEPVTKKFETRQLIYERIVKKMASRLFKQFGVKAQIEVTFPEMVIQDRSAKFKDMTLAETQGWISKKRAAEMAAKDLNITEYNYEDEKKEISDQTMAPDLLTNPLSSIPMGKTPDTKSSITSKDKAQLKNDEGY